MKAIKKLAFACLLACACTGALAQTFTGHLANDNDVAYHQFTLERASGVYVWTDSFQNWQNFDPVISVWSNGVLMGANDDRQGLPGQTFLDSLVTLNLNPGTYLIAVSGFANFPKDNYLSHGFAYDSQAPSPITGGTAYRVHLTLPSVLAVPEPAGYAMLLGGLALLAAVRRRAA